jgi:hypothetical protein
MRLKPLFAALLALLPMPALADVTAHYTAGKDAFRIEVDEGGNSRAGIDGKFLIIRRDNVDYLVVYMGGQAKAVELDDLIATAKAQIPAMPEMPGEGGMKFELAAVGNAGPVGADPSITLWSFGPAAGAGGDAMPSGRKLLIAISPDPKLKPVGDVFRRTFDSLIGVFGSMFPDSTGFGPKLREVLGKGTPTSLTPEGAKAPEVTGPMLTLKSVDHAEIDPKRFELPVPVMTAAEFLQGMEPGGSLGDLPMLP